MAVSDGPRSDPPASGAGRVSGSLRRHPPRRMRDRPTATPHTRPAAYAPVPGWRNPPPSPSLYGQQRPQPEASMSGVIHLATEIPGPNSRALLARRARAVPRGVPAVTPIAVVHAEGAVITDADGNRLIDFGGGIGVVNTGHRHPGVVEAVREQLDHFAHVCFPVSTYEPYVALAERLNRHHARRPREAQLLREQRRGGGGERGEGGARVHRAAGHRLFRARLPRAHQPGDGPHLQGDALQEGLRTVRARAVPDSVSLLLPLPRGTGRRPLLPGGPGSARGDSSPRSSTRTRSRR